MRRAAAIALLTCACGLSGSARADEAGPRWRIGFVPSSHPEITASMSQGILLALDQARAAGGPDVGLLVGDDAEAWSTAASTAVRLAAAEGVVALITPPDRGIAHPVAQVGTRAHVPVISTSRAPTMRTTGSTWITSVVPPADAADAAGARESLVPPPVDMVSEGAASPTFADAFRERHGREPDGWAAAGHRAASRIAAALLRVGSDRTVLAAALADAGAGARSADAASTTARGASERTGQAPPSPASSR